MAPVSGPSVEGVIGLLEDALARLERARSRVLDLVASGELRRAEVLGDLNKAARDLEEALSRLSRLRCLN